MNDELFMLKLYMVIIIVQNCILFILNVTSERTPNPHTIFYEPKAKERLFAFTCFSKTM